MSSWGLGPPTLGMTLLIREVDLDTSVSVGATLLGSLGETSEGETQWGEYGTSRQVPLEVPLGLLHNGLGIDYVVSLGD